MDEQGKKIFSQSNSVGAIIIFFVLLFVFAKWGPAINFSSTTQSKGEPLMVSGEGKVFVAPDIAKLSFGIEENGTSLKTVQDSVNKKSNTLTEALKKLGIKEEDIKTSSYSVSPEYDYTNPGSRITGFRVSISYLATIRDFDKVNDAIVAGTAAGANMVGAVSFEVNDKTQKEKLNEARKIAVDEAKEKAKGLAGAAGITLGRIINITEGSNNAPQPIRLMATGDAVAEKAVAQPDIQPGETEINVTVSVSYEIR